MANGHPKFLGLRVVEEEAEAAPTRLGRDLLRVKAEHPEKWVDVYGHDKRAHVQDLVARVRGTSKNRIAGVLDRDGWDAQLVDVQARAEEDGRAFDPAVEPAWVLRVRWSAEKATVDKALREHEADEAVRDESMRQAALGGRGAVSAPDDERAQAAFDSLRESDDARSTAKRSR